MRKNTVDQNQSNLYSRCLHNPLAGRSESGIVMIEKRTLMNTTRTFAIIEYSSDEIFDVVDEMAMP